MGNICDCLGGVPAGLHFFNGYTSSASEYSARDNGQWASTLALYSGITHTAVMEQSATRGVISMLTEYRALPE